MVVVVAVLLLCSIVRHETYIVICPFRLALRRPSFSSTQRKSLSRCPNL